MGPVGILEPPSDFPPWEHYYRGHVPHTDERDACLDKEPERRSKGSERLQTFKIRLFDFKNQRRASHRLLGAFQTLDSPSRIARFDRIGIQHFAIIRDRLHDYRRSGAVSAIRAS